LSTLREQFEAYIEHACGHPDAHKISGFTRLVVFDVHDGEPFVLDISEGKLSSVPLSERPVDWRGADWEIASCVRLDEETLRSLIRGDELFTEAFVAGRLGWASRGLASQEIASRSIYRWLAGIFRMADEEVTRAARSAAWDSSST
jgi:hypothetical protein